MVGRSGRGPCTPEALVVRALGGGLALRGLVATRRVLARATTVEAGVGAVVPLVVTVCSRHTANTGPVGVNTLGPRGRSWPWVVWEGAVGVRGA